MIDNYGCVCLCQLRRNAVCILFSCADVHEADTIVVDLQRAESAFLAFLVGYGTHVGYLHGVLLITAESQGVSLLIYDIP